MLPARPYLRLPRPSSPNLAPASDAVALTTHQDSSIALLIGHGTRDPEGADEFRSFAWYLAGRLSVPMRVEPCFLELAEPSILDAIEHCVELGAGRIVAAPLLLFGAGHQKNDIPAAIQAARALHSGVEIAYGAPLGVQPEMLEALDVRVCAAEDVLPPGARQETAVLLVERGSSDPDANAEVYQLARLYWEGRAFGWVEPCFIGITRPSLEQGLARCQALGARRIIVVPYFLFSGVLVRRIGQVVADLYGRDLGLTVTVAEHLGRHSRILDLAVRRIEEVGRGEVRMSCDRCKYRVALPGFEHQVGSSQQSDAAHGLRRGTHQHGAASHPHSH